MSPSRDIDYIIVGQGLAGSALALHFLKRGKKILVIDRTLPHSASRVAVGLFNPITGRNLVKTWMADEIFPFLHTFYRDAEKITRDQFFYPMPLYRPFGSVEEQNEWMAKSGDPAYQSYLHSISTKASNPAVNDHFGGMLLRNCGYIDTIRYLQSVRMFIKDSGFLLEELFDDNRLDLSENSVHYKGYKASALIFCQGMETNKWFDWVPVLPLKGETIRIQGDHSENIIINRGVYAVPANQTGNWRVGATYSLTDKSEGITDQAKTELTSKLNDLLRFHYTVVDQQWGIRPTTHDRKPVLGRHPEHRTLYILNGMGPKGVSLAPYFSGILVQYIENHKSLNKDVDIERYKLLYWSPSTRI